jgi:hypothetical protein
MTLVEPAAVAARRLTVALEREGYQGWDPYDALSSRCLRTIARTALLRQTAIQALKWLPVNLRPILGVPRQQHTKGLALVVQAYSRLAQTEGFGAPYRDRARELGDALISRAVPASGSIAWGYDFDVQTRWGRYSAGQPNAIATAFASHALLDLAEATGGPRVPDLCLRALDYACSHLLQHSSNERYFAYFTGGSTPIHNANLLMASVFARVGQKGPGFEAARAAVDYSLRRQRSDGTWPYGETESLSWVDGYHTGYVLESLAWWHRNTGDAAIRDALVRGLDVYITALIEADGLPRATLTSKYPADIHASATAISTLSRLHAYDPRTLPTAESVLRWTLRRMQRRDGRFAFQHYGYLRNAVPYVRWSDGHMLLALSSYLRAAIGATPS